MHSGSKRTSMPFLCLLCVLFIGMCLGTIPADSLLEYTNFPAADAENALPASSIRSAGKAVPSAQVFEHRAFGQWEAALTFRHTTRRHSARTGRNMGSVLVTAGLFSLPVPRLTSPCFCELFQEVFSHTVILNYIHRQDGQKAPSPFFP